MRDAMFRSLQKEGISRLFNCREGDAMIIGRCTFDGCALLTIGSRCVEHDFPVTRTFVRGRPFQRNAATYVASPPGQSSRAANASTVHAPLPAGGEMFTRA